MSRVSVLEVGGTHVTSARVQTDQDGRWSVHAVSRLHLDADASADALLARFAEAGALLRDGRDVAGRGWGVAMPDPFDYARGVGLFDAAVGKFGALHGVDVGAALTAALGAPMTFVNDADAFTLGEWAAGAGRGSARTVGITLGTGVGSGWLVDGHVVDPGTPPGGRIHHMTVDGVPLEDVMSRRAIRRAYAAVGGDPAADVREIAAAARAGEQRAAAVIDNALRSLGAVVGPLVRAFGGDVLVVGGSMAASWDIFDGPFRAGAGIGLPTVRAAQHPDDAGLIGAAAHLLTRASA